MELISEVTPYILVTGFTMATVEAIKHYINIPKPLLWIPVVGFSVGINYLLTYIGVEAVTLEEAIKLGFVSGGVYGLVAEPVYRAIKKG